jgi:hypothetical protein
VVLDHHPAAQRKSQVIVINCPTCPTCDTAPRFVLNPEQAICGNEDCATFCWDMTKTLDWNLTHINFIDPPQMQEVPDHEHPCPSSRCIDRLRAAGWKIPEGADCCICWNRPEPR